MSNNVASVVMVLNGQTVNLTSLDGVTWTAQFQVPSGSSFNLTNGKYAAQITATYETGGSTTVNGSGSDALSQKARLAVYETTKPTASVVLPTANAYYTASAQTLDFSIVDNSVQTTGFSGVKLSSLSAVLASVSLGVSHSYGAADFTQTAITGGYRFTKDVVLDDALDWTLTINCDDNDGNHMDTVTIPFRVDTVAPLLSVDTPTVDFKTNVGQITCAGTTDAETLRVEIDGAFAKNLTLVGGEFDESLTLSSEGEHAISFIAIDAAGNRTTVNRTVTYSTAVPQITNIAFSPDPAAGGGVGTITVTVVPYES